MLICRFNQMVADLAREAGGPGDASVLNLEIPISGLCEDTIRNLDDEAARGVISAWLTELRAPSRPRSTDFWGIHDELATAPPFSPTLGHDDAGWRPAP